MRNGILAAALAGMAPTMTLAQTPGPMLNGTRLDLTVQAASSACPMSRRSLQVS